MYKAIATIRQKKCYFDKPNEKCDPIVGSFSMLIDAETKDEAMEHLAATGEWETLESFGIPHTDLLYISYSNILKSFKCETDDYWPIAINKDSLIITNMALKTTECNAVDEGHGSESCTECYNTRSAEKDFRLVSIDDDGNPTLEDVFRKKYIT